MTKVIFKSISLIGVFLIALAKCPGEMPPRNHDLEEPMPDMPRRRENIIHRVFYDNSTKLPTIDELPQAVTLKQLIDCNRRSNETIDARPFVLMLQALEEDEEAACERIFKGKNDLFRKPLIMHLMNTLPPNEMEDIRACDHLNLYSTHI